MCSTLTNSTVTGKLYWNISPILYIVLRVWCMYNCVSDIPLPLGILSFRYGCALVYGNTITNTCTATTIYQTAK